MVSQDVEKAKDYYLSSAIQGFVHSQAALGIHLIDQGQFQHGIHWLKQALQSVSPRKRGIGGTEKKNSEI